jgi:hypothetical protein
MGFLSALRLLSLSEEAAALMGAKILTRRACGKRESPQVLFTAHTKKKGKAPLLLLGDHQENFVLWKRNRMISRRKTPGLETVL